MIPKRYKRCDVVNVIDLETTCWEDENTEAKRALGFEADFSENETIEIGLCVFDSAQHIILEKRSILVKPVRTTVTEFCTKLTGHTQEELDKNGIPYVEACSILKNQYDSQNVLFASWGDFDREQFEREDGKTGIANYPFGRRHLNIKTMFALKHKLPKEVSVGEAIEMIGKKFEGRQHNGADDAYNIALLLADVLQ